MEFLKSSSPTPSAAVTDAELYRLPGLSRILVVQHPSCPSNQAHMALGGRRLKETRGDRLAQTAIINRAAVPCCAVPFPHEYSSCYTRQGTRGARKPKPQISGSRWAIPFLAYFKSNPRYFPTGEISQRACPRL